jgi:hypothetical protein
MNENRSAVGGAQRVRTGVGRVIRAWQALPPERRLAALAAVGLSLTLFLPWYQETVIADGFKTLQSVSATLTGWGAFSFVEAALLLVAIGVLVLLFQRAEGRAFHLPGGDGWVITAAGLWTCVLVMWRIFDKQGGTVHGQYATTYGIEWGIFVALGVAAFLAYAGSRIRAAHRPEPPLPGEEHQPTPRRKSAQPSDRPVGSPPPVQAEGPPARSRSHHAPSRIRGTDPLPSLDDNASGTRIPRAKPVPRQNDEDPTEQIRRSDRSRGLDENATTRIRRRDRSPGLDGEDWTARIPRPNPPTSPDDQDPIIGIEARDPSTIRPAPPITPVARAQYPPRSDHDQESSSSPREGEDGNP